MSDLIGTTTQSKASLGPKSRSSSHAKLVHQEHIHEGGPQAAGTLECPDYEHTMLPKEMAPVFIQANSEHSSREGTRSIVMVEQEIESPPQLHLRDSLRNSLGFTGIPSFARSHSSA